MPRILVVDDDTLVLKTTVRILKKAGYDVDGVLTLSSGFSKFDETSYDLVIADHRLPDGFGIDLLEHVAQTRPTTGRMLSTAYLQLDLALKAVNGSAVAQVLEKPFEKSSLLRTVEVALRHAAVEGAVSREWTPQRPVDRRSMEMLLRSGSVQLALQPIVAASDSAVIGYEALLRSDDAVLDEPGKILSLAERVGMMRQLSDTLVARASEWLFRLPDEPALFVNLHPLELADPSALADRLDPLRDWSDRMVLEVTGASLQRWPQDLAQRLAVPRDMGFGLALDDVGAGQGALVLLAEVAPRFIKIDMSITRDINRDPHKRKMVELLSTFALSTGARLVAEGVEDLAEAEALRAAGVPLMQGYLFGRPSRSLDVPA
ncbi:MAG: EAL domain-containing response regulator [Myxococcota bacterium]|nr:EAL domain-containing response regulator [Myxococcota bacterium]